MPTPKFLLALVALLGTIAGSAQPPMVTKYLYEFDTLGAGHPNDLINDNPALVRASSFFQARGGYGELILEDGEYIIGRQELWQVGDPVPDTTWEHSGYSGDNSSPPCRSLVANQSNFTLKNCVKFTVQGGTNTTVRYRDCLYYGTFFRDELTDSVITATGDPNCLACNNAAHDPDLLHAAVGVMFFFWHCDSITVRDLELDGNIDNAILGGRSRSDGMQTEYDGVDLYESSRCTVDKVRAHHFGRDGLHIFALYTDTNTLITEVHEQLVVDMELADSMNTTPGNYTVIFNNTVLNSSFSWNCRTGLAWAGCAGLTVTDCEMNFNAAGRFGSSTASGLDIEGIGGPMRVRHGVFTDCDFLHNAFTGVLSDNGQCIGQQDFEFHGCVMKAGESGSALWPESKDMEFYDCEVYGRVGEEFERAENLLHDPEFDLLFQRTNFHEEDEQWSYLIIDTITTPWSAQCAGGPHKLDMVGSGHANIMFDSCGFYTNCRGVVRLKGRAINDTSFPYCYTCPDCADSTNTCDTLTCVIEGPCQGADCAQQNARYVNVKNCWFVNTGRTRCGTSTQLIAVDYTTTLNNLKMNIPDAVRGGTSGDIYTTPFGTNAPPCFPTYCNGDTAYTTYNTSEPFPLCLPFFSLEALFDSTFVRWNFCDTLVGNIPVEACLSDANCYSDLAIADSTLSSALSSPVAGTVYVEGLFIVDQDFIFDSAMVKMAPGAEINIQGGATLQVLNSSVSSCVGVMWKSMTVDSLGTLMITNSQVDEAENVVDARDGSTVILTGNQFRNNRVMLQVPTVALVPVYSISTYMVNNTIFSAGTMPQPYPGQTTAVGAQGYAAFDVDRINLDLTAGLNQVHHMSNGLVAVQCDLTVDSCTFQHIQPDSAYAHYANGSAICARGPKTYHTLKQQGYGNGPTATPSFEDCYWGIYTEYMNVYSKDNFMLDVGTACRIDRSGYMHVQIHDNRLDTRRDAIVLAMNDGAAEVLVEHNHITFGHNPGPNENIKGYWAIRVLEANTLNPNSQIINNTIYYRPQASTGHGGVSLTSARGYLVANNSMHMFSNLYNRVGVLLSGCTDAKVICNDVLGANNGYLHLGQAGIRNWMGTAPLISCNTVDRTTNGLLFSGYTIAEVRGNEIKRHKYGFHLELNAIIGPQDHRGNLWLDTAQVWGAWCESATIADQSLVTVDPGAANIIPSSYSPPALFDLQAGTTFSCNDGLGECVGFKERCTDCAGGFYETIADSTLENGAYTDETRWAMQGDLYEILKNDSILLEDPAMQAFYEGVQSTVVGALRDVDEERIALYNIDTTVIAQLEQNRVQLMVLQLEIKLALEQLSDPNLSLALRNTLQTAIEGLQQNLMALVAYNTQVMAYAANTRILSADEVRSATASIGATALTETNARTVSDIYLSTVAMDVDEFTEQQAVDLFDVANQCPLVGGNAVFQARALYYLISPEQEFDDPALCLEEGLITKNVKPQDIPHVSIVPNPANNMATLKLSEPLDQAGALFIFDAVGAEVARVRIPTDQVSFAISTSALAMGVYHFTLVVGVQSIGNGRLTIAR